MPFQYLSGIVITGSLSTQPLFGSLGLPLSLAVQWQSDSREKRERERGERRGFTMDPYIRTFALFVGFLLFLLSTKRPVLVMGGG